MVRNALWLTALALVPVAWPLAASDEVAEATAVAVIGPPDLGGPGAQAVNFAHRDCVGPGLPGTFGPHATHTGNVPGFVLNPGAAITVTIIPLSFAPPGPCPTTLNGPLLAEDFTGRYRVILVCRQTINDGATLLDWRVDFLLGFPTSQASAGVPCVDLLNDPFSLDVTVAITSTTVLGVPVGPVGGIRLGITQP